jgi:glyoxylase-like metal-dependent hydrolase (beta-lactamase superfamily II)
MIKAFVFDSSDRDLIANSYVVGLAKGPCVIVDLGVWSERMKRYIEENHTGVVGILLTHGHSDHIAGINEFLKDYQPTIFIDRNEVEFLTNTRLNLSYHDAKDVTIDYGNVYYLDDEDEINFGSGLEFKVIETPFHTKGSICYYLKSESALFSGDTLFKGAIGRTDLPTGSSRTIDSSLDKLIELPEDTKVFPGHGEETTIGREKRENIYLNRRKL